MNGNRLLDTNIVVRLMNGDPRITARIGNAENFLISSIVLGELYFGAVNSGRVAENLARIQQFKEQSAVLNCDSDTARQYADVRLALRKKGRPIPENDIWIAASALQHGLTLVTRDRHFNEIAGLQIEVW
ncbi:MAG: type II toxin-antitoxin system VapC family toxin [Chloroflexota bacterium]